LIDLCYQTLAFAEIDRPQYADKIKRNSNAILSLQREDGQWSMLFEPASTPSISKLTIACIRWRGPGTNPEPSAGSQSLKFLMSRQQPFGGCSTRARPTENFRTPFRETQFAVTALSETL